MNELDLFIASLFEESDKNSHIMMANLYPKIEAILSTKPGDIKFKRIIGEYMDRNAEKLHTAGPVYLIPFADTDKAMFFNLFGVTGKEITEWVKEVTKQIGSSSDFKLLSGNPIFWVFYCCIRYYTLKKDSSGLNSALAIYAISVYPSVFTLFFPHGADEAVMQYTIDNLSNKYIIKNSKHLFAALFTSINNSYKFLSPYMKDASDSEMIRFIQRIRNDQKSMIKNICGEYMKNHKLGNRVRLNKSSVNPNEIQIDDTEQNNTSKVDVVTNNIVNNLYTNGLDLQRVTQAKDIAQISFVDCRFYLSKIFIDKYTTVVFNFIQALLFLYLYDENKNKEDINSSNFILWANETFKKTNSNNPNIKLIKNTLDKWGDEIGIHSKFKREASRVNYKKAIYWYIILSIQYYNK